MGATARISSHLSEISFIQNPMMVKRFIEKLESMEHVKKYFLALEENHARMTAISLLNIIITLLPFYRNVGRMEEALRAFTQAWDLMTFIENSDPQHPTSMDFLKVIDIEADRVSVAAYNEFQRLLNLRRQVLSSSETSEPSSEASQDITDAVSAIYREAEEKLKQQKPRKTQQLLEDH